MSNSIVTPIVNKVEGVFDRARETAANAGDRAGQAASAVGDMASQAACDIGQKANDLTASAGASIKGLGDKLSQNVPSSGVVGIASQSVAKAVHDGGQYMQDAKLSGIVEDVAQLIRRNPIPAVFLAIGLGWVVARKMRN